MEGRASDVQLVIKQLLDSHSTGEVWSSGIIVLAGLNLGGSQAERIAALPLTLYKTTWFNNHSRLNQEGLNF
jgi:hypothetical protein